MEPVEFAQQAVAPQQPEWAVAGTKETRGNMITSLFLDNDALEAHQLHLEAKFRRVQAAEVRAEESECDDAEIVLVGYGIVARILKAVAAEARGLGLKVGVLRPITLYPFPSRNFQHLARTARVFVVVEMSNGQMVDDVRLALNGARPVELVSRVGGNVPSHAAVLRYVEELAERGLTECDLADLEPEEERVIHV
jgi:pyruvate/2-oxoacid:ferredoxin oxidoreductase alpha subunit